MRDVRVDRALPLVVSGCVQVFGRRQRREARHAELTGVQKAPRHEVAEVWHRQGSGRYGDLIRVPTLVVNVAQGGWELRMDVQTMPRAHDGHLSTGSECGNGHSAH
jgi:hypothetical protein